MKSAVIMLSDLKDCWLPQRFCGGDCPYLLKCKRAAKKDCRAQNIERMRVTHERQIFASGTKTEWREV